MSLEGWNSFWQWSSAIAAGVTFVAGAGAIITGSRLSARQQTEIAVAKRGAAEANKVAAQAGEGTATALREVALANERAGRLELEAAGQRERAEVLSRDTQALRQQNLATEARLEAERNTRLRLERALAPRQFFIAINPDNFTGLRPFAGTNGVIKHASDVEARRAADQIATLLRFAGWNVTVTADPDMTGTFWDGVVVAPHLPKPKDPWNMTEMQRLERAAASVVTFLTAQGWAARTFPGSTQYPANTVQIGVGLKPLPAPTP